MQYAADGTPSPGRPAAAPLTARTLLSAAEGEWLVPRAVVSRDGNGRWRSRRQRLD